MTGGAVTQSGEVATPSEEVLSSIPGVVARSLLVGSVSVSCDRLRQKPWSPCSVSCVAAHKIVRRQSWDPSAIYSLVDEDVKKPNKETHNDLMATMLTLDNRESSWQ